MPTGALLEVSWTTSVTVWLPPLPLLSRGEEKYSIPWCRALTRCRAVVSGVKANRKRPSAPVTTESTGPWALCATRWSTTRAPPTGTESSPAGRTTIPETDWAARGPARKMKSARATFRD
jgi:hypothetical protein